MTSMSNKGDDCYFFYYSTCTKGDACPFRHCEAAMGNEIVCSLWQENRCFRNVCKFRHMEIKKNRKEIPCYWENQPGGCQKFHCAFHHEKPRLIDGLFVAPDKGTVVKKDKEEETPQDDHVSSVSANMSNTTNPQLRGVIKVETQESVPSPTHPPVVINPVDDEDDEDVDQFSEEGEEVSGVSPKKLLSSSKDESLNFGIKSLEEIRLGKALKASLNRPGHPLLQGCDSFTSTKQSSNGTGTEKEKCDRSITQAVTTSESPAVEDFGKRKITDRLGKHFEEDMHVAGDEWLKGSLAKRLGGFVDSTENKINMPIKKVKTQRPVRERLGITPDIAAPKSPNSEPKPSGEIHIKTLEEIRQEKAAKSQTQCKGIRGVAEVPTKMLTSSKKLNKPFIGPSVKTFSEVLHEKKKFQETKVISQQNSNSTEKNEDPTNTGVIKLTDQTAEIRVKTLEEIRKEKAARMQAKTLDTTNDEVPCLREAVPKRRMLCVAKTASAIIRSQKVHDSEKMDCIEESTVTSVKSDSSIQDITVKSFEEIMREKKLRKQQEHAVSTVEPEQAAVSVLCEKKPPAVISPGITIQANAIQQGKSHQASSPVFSVVPQRKFPERPNKENALAVSHKKSFSSVSLPVQVSDMADSLGQRSQEQQRENSQIVTKMPPNKADELKVRPKLNVKPSVMKPAAQVKPGQKRKAAGIHCSAVAEVKPLNAVPTPDDEPPCKQTQSAPSCSLEDEARVQQVSSTEQCSSKPRTPTQTRPRRASLASARTSAPTGNSSTADDLEDLLDEFTDDRLEDEIELDPGKGEDDLLLELSEMIDS
ncbi:zinc finger CCCH domain-containing protein 11A isoform X1 [Tachysurus vachellii]|uniref:zinc finger CCCH domain-containing protein 11A isoform X1 n=1 Tax=Tachysurus vachellii TaxID=175792 RepID=UPI00296A9E38|nr:zinc finger CCCH domain-containing protein 11A isoform X1 [Tachysurus vachellii]XP_060713492.1 zinc finger CCCH domain-containing protein 11A isoform X1 [Tachysurus vachellii]XP_060713493.1 zinc finger CCCH domain-containing protein 11A isoform X1 [Tachysurus vachellii]